MIQISLARRFDSYFILLPLSFIPFRSDKRMKDKG